ncbi:phosphopyruvate hydratase [Leptospira kanakyensis]|uniref:phosphopyruvate hydratase n=1 Tax=Leptospira kanakyensis TaxID=2484968 RepID=UPI00223D3E62|nr:phosphopyruvate hydratase [Leptospira kanakyensis]
MSTETKIQNVFGRQIWDSRGRPTVEVEVHLTDGNFGSGIAPAGASKGKSEALDLRDNGSLFAGFGVKHAIQNVNGEIAENLIGKSVLDQDTNDRILVQLDGTKQKTRLGANALIATSMAMAHAAANSLRIPLWKYLQGNETKDKIYLPLPEIQIFGGGANEPSGLDIQDFMILPFGAKSFSEAMEWTAEIHLAAMSEVKVSKGIQDNEQTIEILIKAIEKAGFSTKPSSKNRIGISLDFAASHLFVGESYHLKSSHQKFTKEKWFEHILKWINQYPIDGIEDPFIEEDLESYSLLMKEIEKLDRKIQLVGDDLLTTQIKNIEKVNQHNACNTLLCKPNQVGTLTEAKDAFLLANKIGWDTIVSARSGESEDTTICHLALGWGIKQIKVGSFSHAERMAKWNELIRLEERLGKQAVYVGSLFHS